LPKKIGYRPTHAMIRPDAVAEIESRFATLKP